MKRSPEMKRLEEVLRASRIVAGGFLGKDSRILEEIIETDAMEVARLGYTVEHIGKRMRELTDKARQGLGTPVKIDKKREGIADDNRGVIVCPWPHAGRYNKTVTTVRHLETGKSLRWSDLSVHFIESHGFFQGRGSAFRLEPRDLVHILFE